jgi:GntP family gluconate:H+ symporter
LPIILPIILILLKSVAEFPSKPFGNSTLRIFLSFVGDPVSALLLGVLASLLLVQEADLKNAISDWVGEGIKQSAMVLVITAAGGSLSAVIRASPITDFIKTSMGGLHLGIFLPFILSAALKTAQGSSMVAIVTTAGIIAPLLPSLGLDPSLTTIAIGAGSMVVSHANDSYFWVVSQFSGMPVNIAYKAYSPATAIEGFVAFLAILLLSLFVH